MKHEKKEKNKKGKQDSASLKEEHLNELKESLSSLSSDELNKMMKLLQFDTINEVLDALENFETTPVKVWEKIVMKLQVLKKAKPKDVKEKAKNKFDFYAFLDILISLLSVFLGTAFAFKCNEACNDEVAQPLPKDFYSGVNNKVPNIPNDERDIVTNKPISSVLPEEDADKNFAINPSEYPKESVMIYKAAVDKLKVLEQSLVFTYCQTHFEYWNFRPTTKEEYRIWETTGYLADYAWDGSIDSSAGTGYEENFQNSYRKPISTEDFVNNPCCISMCKDIESTDFDELFATNVLNSNAAKVVVELDRNRSHELCVELWQHIKPNDVIGYIENIPIKSKIDCIVDRVEPDYFIGTYASKETADVDYEAEFTKYNYINDAFTEMNELMQTNAYVLSFIKDFVLFTRKPFIALHTREHVKGDANVVSFEDYVTDYENRGRKLISEYNDVIKSRFNKEFLEPYAENNKIVDVKSILDNDKNTMIQKIISLYNGYKNIKLASLGRISDFLLCDSYIEYLTSDDFYYDEANPYIVKLHETIEGFIQRRLRVEKNTDNIKSDIDNFNELCESVLKAYFKNRKDDINYYNEFNKIFATSYGSINNQHPEYDESTTLFTKVLDYLKVLTNYTKPESPTEPYSDDMNLEEIMKGMKGSESQDEEIKKLRKIAYAYISIREKATSKLDISMFKSEDIENFSTLTVNVNKYYSGFDFNNQELDEDGNVIDNSELFYNKTLLENYLSSLKKLTETESLVLEDLGKKAIEWYSSNYKNIDEVTFLEQFVEIPWPEPSLIFKITVPHDFYYIEYKETCYEGILKRMIPSYDDSKGDQGDSMNIVYDNDGNKIGGSPNEKKDKTDDIPDCPIDFDTYDIDNDDTNLYVNSQSGPNQYLYWLKYMGWATLVNCMLPLYWSTGLIIMGAPLPLPIIYLPFVAISGRVTVVIGLGICGICPLPMIYLVNMSNIKGTVIFPINTVIDTIINGIKALLGKQSESFSGSLTPLIEAQDAMINSIQGEIDNTQQQIDNMKTLIKGNKLTLKNIKRKDGECSSTKEYNKETSN